MCDQDRDRRCGRWIAVAGFFGWNGSSGSTYVASIWLWLPSGQATIGGIGIGAEGNSTYLNQGGADVTKPNQWQRIWTVFTLTAAATNIAVRIYLSTPAPVMTVYLTCPQVELAQPQTSSALPTSYISTTSASSVTRSPDGDYSARQIFRDPAYSTMQPLLIGIQQPWHLRENTLDIPLRDASY